MGEPPDRRVPWGAIAGLLIFLIILIGGALWLLRGDDGGEEDTEVTASTTSTTTSTTTTIGPTTTPPPTTSEVPASAADLGPPTLSNASTVSTVGLDTVQFGMTVPRAQEAAGAFMIPTGPTSDCYTVLPDGGPHGVTFTVIDSTIERVDIDAGAVTTRSGIGIGTPEDVVTERFGAQLQRSVNDDGSVDLIFVPTDENDAAFRVIFTVANGNVFRFRAGKMPDILDSAPCTGAGQDQAGSSSS
jgi:hypothetical protein